MVKYTIKVDGMQCSMCEAHINDAVRKAVPVKKVNSSHRKGQTIVITEAPVDEAVLTKTINDTGYSALSITQEPYEKKGFFH